MQWVVKLLGGFTESEMDAVRFEAEARQEAVDGQISFYQNLLESKDEEIKRLTNLMLTRAGFMIGEKISQTEIKQHEPINRRQTWAQRQKELEKLDAKLAADQTEAYWKEKQAQDASS